MSYVDEHLNANESVVFRTTLHPIVFAGPVILALLAIMFGFQRELGEIAAGMFGLAVIVAMYVTIQFVTSEFAVTSSRVIIKIGWLSRRTVELQLAKVEGIVVEQDIIGRMLNYGGIVVGGTGGTKEPFKFIRSPIVFRKKVQEQIEIMAPQQGALAGYGGSVSNARDERECPHCAERILLRATRCRFCGQVVQ